MKGRWWFRFSVLVFLVVLAGMSLVPSFKTISEDSSYPMKSKINLGLDLQGGLYMVLGIDFNKVYRDETKGMGQKLLFLLKDNGISATVGNLDLSSPEDPKIEIIIDGDVQTGHDLIKDYVRNAMRLTREEGNIFEYGLVSTYKNNVSSQAVTKSIEVIRNRIDEFGVTEPEILSLGEDRIIVQLPGVKDIDKAKELIGKTAKLEFKLVNDEVSPATMNEWIAKAKAEGIDFKKGDRFSTYLEKLNVLLRPDLPKGYSLAFQKKTNAKGDITEMTPYVVETNAQLTGDELQDASTQVDPQKNEPYVAMNFKSQGAKIFEDLTGNNVGRRLAVILDGNVYTAPNINERIGGGRSSISLGFGSFNELMEQARDISLVLRAGALPVELDFQEQRVVGASLGADAIEKAKLASMIGSILVLIFILVYYKTSGLIAVISLALNVVFVLACLVAFEATLTLPGIAGIALTVGMAIDASIIIYERIREEVHKERSPFKSVENGFNSAFWTILDANITTALAGIMLLNFGTGPIRGFAVTLLIGIVATVYTAYFVTRMLFEFYIEKSNGKKLSI